MWTDQIHAYNRAMASAQTFTDTGMQQAHCAFMVDTLPRHDTDACSCLNSCLSHSVMTGSRSVTVLMRSKAAAPASCMQPATSSQLACCRAHAHTQSHGGRRLWPQHRLPCQALAAAAAQAARGGTTAAMWALGQEQGSLRLQGDILRLRLPPGLAAIHSTLHLVGLDACIRQLRLQPSNGSAQHQAPPGSITLVTY
jgi:hypothetical protein